MTERSFQYAINFIPSILLLIYPIPPFPLILRLLYASLSIFISKIATDAHIR